MRLWLQLHVERACRKWYACLLWGVQVDIESQARQPTSDDILFLLVTIGRFMQHRDLPTCHYLLARFRHELLNKTGDDSDSPVLDMNFPRLEGERLVYQVQAYECRAPPCPRCRPLQARMCPF